ncbi:MAG: hypothetical protein ABI855_07045 [Bacteroidota bacterium]
MLAVKGIYDGKNVQLLENVNTRKSFKVIVTFIEEVSEKEDIKNLRKYSEQTSGFEFWEDPKEDIYQDKVKKNRK